MWHGDFFNLGLQTFFGGNFITQICKSTKHDTKYHGIKTGVLKYVFALPLLVLLLFCACSNHETKTYDKVLVINELMPSNRTGLLTSKGKLEDWIEIKNISADTIDLEGYIIEIMPARLDTISAMEQKSGVEDEQISSDETAKNSTWEFPSFKISGGECIVVFAKKGKKSVANSNELTAKLKLPKDGGIVRLLAPDGSVLTEIEYGKLSPDQSLQRQENGAYVTTYQPSPGYDNTREGYEASCIHIDAQRHSPLLIWELMSRVQKSTECWVELKNVSDSVVDLSSYRLSKKMGKGEGWALPAKTLQSGELISIKLAGKRGKKEEADFKLGDAETVVLTRNGKFVDGVCAKSTIYGTSIGRSNSHKGFFYYSLPSRNAENGADGRRHIAEKPQFDRKAGIYKNKERLCLHLSAQGRTIHYTLDGSEPTSFSPIYKDSIVITQSTVIRAFAEGDSMSLSSDIATATYMLGVKHDMPVVNISVNNDDLYDYRKGIYADGPGYTPTRPHTGANYWKNWTKKAHVEFFDGKEGFSVDCGLKIFGGCSRCEAKKSFCLKFKRDYGCPEVNYDFFGNGEVLTLKDLVLRSGSQDYDRCMLRDEFFTSLLKTYSPTLITQIYRPIALYINAEYFGLYYIREKIDKHFVARQLNVSTDSINIIFHKGYNEKGSNIPYKQLMQYISTHNMADSACYNYVRQMVDLQGLIDQKLGQIYSGNIDVGNIRYVRSTDQHSDRKWHFIFYDLDATWVGNKPTAEFYLSTGGSAATADVGEHNMMVNKLLANKTFRRFFLRRLSHHMHHTFATENATAVFDNLVNQIRSEMKLNCERWPELGYDEWERNIADFRNKFATKPKAMLDDLRKYLSITDEENKKYFGDLGF